MTYVTHGEYNMSVQRCQAIFPEIPLRRKPPVDREAPMRMSEAGSGQSAVEAGHSSFACASTAFVEGDQRVIQTIRLLATF